MLQKLEKKLSLIWNCSLCPLANTTHIHWFLGPVSFLGLHSQNISPLHTHFSISFLFLCLRFLISLFPSILHSVSATCHFLWWLPTSISVLPILSFCSLCKSQFSPHMLLFPVQPAGSPQKGLRSVSCPVCLWIRQFLPSYCLDANREVIESAGKCPYSPFVAWLRLSMWQLEATIIGKFCLHRVILGCTMCSGFVQRLHAQARSWEGLESLIWTVGMMHKQDCNCESHKLALGQP